MANGILGFEGPIPEYIRKAAQNALDLQRISKNKLPLAVEGSGIPDSVRKAAQNALEGKGRYAPAPEATPSVAEGAKGVGKFLGPIGGILAAGEGVSELNEAFGPSRYETVKGAVESKQAKDEYDPAAYGRSQGVVSRGIMAATDAVQSGAKQYAQEAAQGKRPVSLLNPDAKPATQTPVGKAVDAVAPNAPAPAKAAASQQVESQRQVVEAGAKEQLKTNQVTRPQLAAAVVQADVQRSGQELTPKQYQARVAEETAAMKSMDNDQLSRYVSYALVAGGLIAAAVDKSGDAGRAFAGSFNAQLDRNQQMAMFQYKQKAAAEAAAREAALEERKLGVQERNVESQIADRESQAKRREDMSVLDERKLAAQERRWATQSANENARLQAYRERTAKGGEGGKAATPPELSTKDATTLVDTYSKAKGVEIDDNAKATAADAYRRYRKAYPDLTADELMELTLGDLEKTEGDEGIPFVPFTGSPDTFGIKQ